MDEIQKYDNTTQEFNIGKTQIKVYNNYCNDKTQKDINKVLTNIARSTHENIDKKYFHKKDKGKIDS